MRRYLIISLIVFGSLWSAMSGASASNDAAPFGIMWSENEPLEVNAEGLTFDSKGERLVFDENVTVSQSEFQLSCQHLEIRVKDNRVLSFSARGAVVLVHREWRVEAETLTYDANARVLTLEGQPTMQRGNNVIRGLKITLDFDTREVHVEQANTRVEIPKADVAPRDKNE